MAVIDTHTHVYEDGFWPAKWFDHVATSWAESDPSGERAPEHVRPGIEGGLADPDGARMIEHMDKAGVDLSVVLPLDWELGIGPPAGSSIREILRSHHRIAQANPDRIISFVGVDPQREDAVEIFDWAVDELDMRGLKLYPPTGFYPFDPRVEPLYERCEAAGHPVLIHTGETISMLRPRFSDPIFLQDVLAVHPKLRLWIGHSGAPFWWEKAVAIAETAPHAYLELSSWDQLRRSDEREFVRRICDARDRVGAHRLLFGSDHISGRRVRGEENLLEVVAWFRRLPEIAEHHGFAFSEAETQLLLGDNAARCLLDA